MRLQVELFSTFQCKVRRRTAHQCHTRPRQVAHAAPLPRRRAKQPGVPANVLPAALCQGVFEASAVLKTLLVCFSPKAPLRGGRKKLRPAKKKKKKNCFFFLLDRVFFAPPFYISQPIF